MVKPGNHLITIILIQF